MSNSRQVNRIQDLIAQLRAENESLKKENEALKENKKENETLKKENEELKKKKDKLTDDNAKLLNENQNLRQTNTNLQSENTRQRDIINRATQHVYVSLENFGVDYRQEDSLDVKTEKILKVSEEIKNIK
ncbi:hypothetical protein F8M41_007362 [Gigaspora margarita]|uniref:Uncharacterized protein n=1 Tax=Gigaspora margarita TaxID=4874 RepID=A0A8H4ER38_GIGMA|nr:hypothetical protein F8M41_007362 [Gigaspora margarita]